MFKVYYVFDQRKLIVVDVESRVYSWYRDLSLYQGIGYIAHLITDPDKAEFIGTCDTIKEIALKYPEYII